MVLTEQKTSYSLFFPSAYAADLSHNNQCSLKLKLGKSDRKTQGVFGFGGAFSP